MSFEEPKVLLELRFVKYDKSFVFKFIRIILNIYYVVLGA